MKKIKKDILKSAFIAVCCLSLSSCADFLNLTPLNEIIEDNYWDERNDVDQIVTGCYTQMQSSDFLNRVVVWGEMRSENLYVGNKTNDDGAISNILKENILSSNPYTSWTVFYDIINRCNLVIEKAPKVAQKDPTYTESDVRATIAEVSALRALCYFYLIRTFRDVPYYTHAITSDDQKMDFPATKFNDVLDAIIQDLETVQPYAMKVYSNAAYTKGRITQQSIHALLADMYLWKKDYTRADYYAQKVIDAKMNEYEKNGGYVTGSYSSNALINGFPLIADKSLSADNIGNAYNSIFGTGNSFESIFELAFDTDDGTSKNDLVSYFYGNAKDVKGVVAPPDVIGGDMDNGQYLYFNKYDARFYESINTLTTGTSWAISKYVYSNISVYSQAGNSTVPYYGAGMIRSINNANWIFYRLTDVMLMKAEALAEKMLDSDELSTEQKALNDSLHKAAFDLVYAVNYRSMIRDDFKLKITDYPTKTMLLELIMAERRRELMFEGKRWYDLVRQALKEGKTSSLINAVIPKYSSGGSAVRSKLSRLDAIFWPYNKEELKVNKNLVQNPAYGGAGEDSFETTK